jgi:hypothetical protein
LGHQFPAAFVDDEKQDAGGQIFFGLAVIGRPALEPGQSAPDAVVQAFDGKGVRFALDMVLAAEDFGAGMPEIGRELDLGGVRHLRSQPPGRLGSTNSWFSISLSVLAIPQGKNRLSQLNEDGWTYFSDIESEAETKTVLKTLAKSGALPGIDTFTSEQVWKATRPLKLSVVHLTILV